MSEETEKAEEEIETETDEAPTEEAVDVAAAEEGADADETSESKPVEEVDPRSKPSVIDLDALLKPISAENPSGESVRYSGIYDEISDARRADDDLNLGEWEHELKVADFPKVIELASKTLAKETKDLQIAAWFSEAVVRQHGFLGLRDSLKLLTGILESFWETAFPEIDEGDEEGRANALVWMDREAALAIQKAPITEGEGYGLLDYSDAKTFDIPENYENLDSAERNKFAELKERAEKGNRTTADKWKRAVIVSKRAFYEDLDFALQECWTEYERLNKTMEEKFDPKQIASLSNLKKALDDIQTQTDKLLQKKRDEEPDPIDEMEIMEENTDGTGTGGTGSGLSSGGAINNRREALRRLTEVARFFSHTEPHSPVSYLVNRAVKWGEMPLDSWLSEVIKDEAVLSQLKETLGFGLSEVTAADESWSGDGSESTEETAAASTDDDW